MVIFHLPFLWFSSLTQLILGTGVQSISSMPNPTNQPHYTFDQLYNLQVKFFDNFIYPADITQAKSINSTLLAEDVQGRIDVTGTFDGRELNTEYLFGLFANVAADPNSISLLGVPISYEILHFAANEYITSAATRFMFNFTCLGLIVPIEIDSWSTWNEAGQVTQYDGSFKYWQWAVDYIIASRYLFISAFRICLSPTVPLYSMLLRLLRRLKFSLEHWRAVFVKQQQVIAMVQIYSIAIWRHAISISPRKCGLVRRMNWVGILYCAEWCIEIWYHFDHLCTGMLILDF
jgi:hypothetical protein